MGCSAVRLASVRRRGLGEEMAHLPKWAASRQQTRQERRKNIANAPECVPGGALVLRLAGLC